MWPSFASRRKLIMHIPIYHVDAFTDRHFSGNPAAVCILEKWPTDDLLFSIAKENNLPVTVFLVRENNIFHLRWLAPEYELILCGHGTLAASFIINNFLEPTWDKIRFLSPIAGSLDVTVDNGALTLIFPVKSIEKCEHFPLLNEGLGLVAKEIYQYDKDRCLVVYQSEDEVKNLKPDLEMLKQMPLIGITVTARGKDCDYVSRVFYPKKIISEDAATGSSHCVLAPFWAKQLNKTEFYAKQLSQRGGAMHCRLEQDRVLITANAVLFKKGEIIINSGINIESSRLVKNIF